MTATTISLSVERETIRIAEAQQRFSISRTTLYRMRRYGHVRAYRIGSAVLLDLASLRAAIAAGCAVSDR